MDAILTIATVPAIVALVTIAKDLGVPSRFSPLLAMLLGVLLALFDLVASGGELTVQTYMQTVGLGLVLGLSASGLYDGARLVGGSREPKAPEVTTEV